MKRITGTIILLFLMSQSVLANQAVSNDSAFGDFPRVHRMSVLGRLHGWSDLDSKSLIVWATPFRPYLIETSRRIPDLKFAQTIRLTSSAGYVDEKFDSVIVRGLRYPIQGIYKLDPASARDLQKRS